MGAQVYCFQIGEFASAYTNTLRPFTTDGCSYAPDYKILDCCIKHDVYYWMGGTSKQRLIADKELRQCAKDQVGKKAANVIYWAVRVFGTPYNKSAFRWGYGWTIERYYQELSDEELRQVERLYPDLNKVKVDVQKKTKHIQSVAGDHCLDQSLKYLIDLNEGDFSISKISKRKNPIGDISYVIITDLKKGHFVFSFNGASDFDCKSPLYQRRKSRLQVRRYYK